MSTIHEQVQQAMAKKFGATNVMNAGDLKALARITYGISAQCLSLDLIIGRPGFPAGRLTEICAPEGSAKSTHAYHILAETQRLGGIGVLLETEQAFEAERLSAFGINTQELILGQPEHMEQAFDMMQTNIMLIREKATFTGPVTIILDSVAGCPTSSEVERGYDEKGMGAAARVISQSLRKLTNLVARHKVVLIFLNQLRSTMQMYGEEFSSYGGKAIKYHASLRLQLLMRKADMLRDDNKDAIGTRIRTRTIKNKLAMPFRDTAYTLYFKSGIDMYDDLLMAGLKTGYLSGGRGRYGYKDTKFTLEEWPQLVDAKLGGVHALREKMTLDALKKDLLKPYSRDI